MIHPLFSDFLEEAQSYTAAEAFWKGLEDEVVSGLAEEGDWQRYQPLYFGDDRTLMTPGDPIWEGRSDRLGRGYRIVQHSPSRVDAPEITAWIKRNEHDVYEGSRFPRSELVIAIALSEESAAIARELLHEWMQGGSVERMEALIRDRLGVEA